MPSANESIEHKYHRFLEQYDLKQAAKLDGTFMNHLAAAIRASSPNERQHRHPIQVLEQFGPSPTWQIEVDYDARGLSGCLLQDTLRLGQ